MLSPEQQRKLTDRVASLLERSGASHLDVLYFLVSFTWGWARRIGWPTRSLASYALKAWEINDGQLSRNYEAPQAQQGKL